MGLFARTAIAGAAGLFLVAAGVPLHGQSRDRSIELWGSWVDWADDEAAEGFTPGPGTGAQATFDVGRFVDLGVELGFNRFDITIPIDSVTTEDFTIGEFQAALTARRWLSERRVRPYGEARVGYARLGVDVSVLRLEQTGFFGGAGAGVRVGLNDRLGLVVAGDAQRQRYGNVEFFLQGVEDDQSGASTWRYSVRAGLSFAWRGA